MNTSDDSLMTACGVGLMFLCTAVTHINAHIASLSDFVSNEMLDCIDSIHPVVKACLVWTMCAVALLCARCKEIRSVLKHYTCRPVLDDRGCARFELRLEVWLVVFMGCTMVNAVTHSLVVLPHEFAPALELMLATTQWFAIAALIYVIN